MAESTVEVLSETRRKAWVKARPAWTRNDSVRWLNDRSAQVLAWVRRRSPERAPSHSQAMGRWLQGNWQADFARAHVRLAGAPDDSARDTKTVLEVLG